MSFLERILNKKHEEAAEAERSIPERSLRAAAAALAPRTPLLPRLASKGPLGANIIAEIKRASPSRGPIRIDLDAGNLARAYERGGAAAVSVLTDQPFFQARIDDLQTVRAATTLPVLRKDFIVSSRQIYEAAIMGADAVLLIVRALSDAMLQDFLGLCGELGMDALVEVHTEDELKRATEAGARLIGINNRDLGSFQTDLEASVRLGQRLGKDQVAVAESGIRGRDDIERLLDAGIWNFLIGESLVRSPDPEAFLQELLGCGDGGKG